MEKNLPVFRWNRTSKHRKPSVGTEDRNTAVSYSAQFRNLRDIASLINASSDLDTILRQIVRAVCRHTLWSMGGIMSIDRINGCAQVIARHDPTLIEGTYEDIWTLTSSPSLKALEKNEAVVIPDAVAASEYPGYQRDAVKRGYRTVAVLPMGCTDAQGRDMVLSVQSLTVADVSADDLAFLQTIVHMGAIAVEKAARINKERHFAERLSAVIDAHSGLMAQVLSNGSIASAVAKVETLLPQPCAVVDLTANAVDAGRCPRPDLVDDESWRNAVGSVFARQFVEAARAAAQRPGPIMREMAFDLPCISFKTRAMVEPLVIDGEAVGALVLFPTADDFSDLDHLLLGSAKFALSVQMMRSYIRFTSEARTLNDLFAEFLTGEIRDGDDLLRRALRLDINLRLPARLIVVAFPAGLEGLAAPAPELHRSIAREVAQHFPRSGVVRLRDTIVARVESREGPDEGRMKTLLRRLMEEARWIAGQRPIVVVSDICQSLSDYPLAWRECERVRQLACRFDRRGLISARDLGPFPVLLSAADTREVRGFVEATIGPLVAHDANHDSAYLATLKTFLEQSCRSQACADAMGLHVTTLRYRLSRMADLFGVETDTPEKRFALELAIRFNDILAQDVGAEA